MASSSKRINMYVGMFLIDRWLLYRLALLTSGITLHNPVLEGLADGGAVGREQAAGWVAELVQAAVGIEVAHDEAVDAVAAVDVVASVVYGGDGVCLLVFDEVVPIVVEGYGWVRDISV